MFDKSLLRKSNVMKYFMWMLFFLISMIPINGACAKNIVYDKPNQDVSLLFKNSNTKYVIRYNHKSKNPVVVPRGCEIEFMGGSISSHITFSETILSGIVKLQGSILEGTVGNKSFMSDWLCYADGIRDDASNINQMIKVCGKVFFKKGIYLLTTVHKGPRVDRVLDEWQADAHIGIARSGVELVGERGAVFLAPKPYMTIVIYSPPYQFDKTVRNIKIQNLTFRAKNSGKDFNQLLHTIRVMGVNGLTIKNCFFDDFFGDAICLHSYGDMPSTGERTRNSNVVIKNNHIKGGKHHSTRNGVSVVNGVNVRIENNLIEETSRKDMPGAIDVEANSHAFSIDNIVIKGNTIRNCGGTAGGICINSKGYNAPAYNIKIIDNHISNCSYGLAFVVKTDNVTKNYLVTGNVVDDDTTPLIFVGNGKSSNWTFKNNVFKKRTGVRIPGNIRVDGLILKKNRFLNSILF